jgi:hypothetical protein
LTAYSKTHSIFDIFPVGINILIGNIEDIAEISQRPVS